MANKSCDKLVRYTCYVLGSFPLPLESTLLGGKVTLGNLLKLTPISIPADVTIEDDRKAAELVQAQEGREGRRGALVSCPVFEEAVGRRPQSLQCVEQGHFQAHGAVLFPHCQHGLRDKLESGGKFPHLSRWTKEGLSLLSGPSLNDPDSLMYVTLPPCCLQATLECQPLHYFINCTGLL